MLAFVLFKLSKIGLFFIMHLLLPRDADGNRKVRKLSRHLELVMGQYYTSSTYSTVNAIKCN